MNEIRPKRTDKVTLTGVNQVIREGGACSTAIMYPIHHTRLHRDRNQACTARRRTLTARAMSRHSSLRVHRHHQIYSEIVKWMQVAQKWFKECSIKKQHIFGQSGRMSAPNVVRCQSGIHTVLQTWASRTFYELVEVTLVVWWTARACSCRALRIKYLLASC